MAHFMGPDPWFQSFLRTPNHKLAIYILYIYTYIHACIHTYIHTPDTIYCTYVSIHMYLYIYIYIHIYIYICIYLLYSLYIPIKIHCKSISSPESNISQTSVLPGANLHDSHGGGQRHAEANRKRLGSNWGDAPVR